MNRGILPIEEPKLKPLANLQARDIVLLITVIMGVKPIATLVVPLEVKGWLQRFCERHGLICFEDGAFGLVSNEDGCFQG
ncbi:MAG: hypothetical protein QW506_02780 [Thermoproteota archaeon]|nr:hypothetical protein [Candidatus Brockarchaeota archaeon]